MAASAAADNILVRAAAEFLHRYPPFDRMAPERLHDLAAHLERAYFSEGEILLSPESGIPGTLYIIERGRVESQRQMADQLFEAAAHSLGPGEFFPVSALLGERATRNRYRALQDTFCLALPARDCRALFDSEPAFRRYCTNHLDALLAQAERDRRGEYAQLAAAQQSLAAPLEQVMTKQVVTVAPGTALEQALRIMASRRISAIVVQSAHGEPVGILTERDALSRVALTRAPLDAPIDDYMTRAPLTLPGTATTYEAALAMASQGIRHIPVVVEGKLAGIVSERDLFGLQRKGLHHIAAAIASAADVAMLRQIAQQIRELIARLLAQGAGGEQLTRMISALNDRLTQRVIALERAKFALDDVPFCWLALGSEGRHEQTLSTDQDNAIIFDGGEQGRDAELRARLLPFAQAVNAALDRCGFPLCKGKVMAGNADWCRSLHDWEQLCAQWLRTPTPEAILNACVFFDFRPIDGAVELAHRLRQFITRLAVENNLFQHLLAQAAVQHEPPLGLLRDFVLDETEEFRGTLDVKAGGSKLFIDAARALAMARGVEATATAERLRALAARHDITAPEIQAAIDAFYFLQMLRLKHQYNGAGAASANRIRPDALNELERRMLKESLRQARALQSRLRLEFNLR